MRFRVLLSGGAFNDEDGLPVDLSYEDDDVVMALIGAMLRLNIVLASVDLVLTEAGHKVASLELEVVKCNQ